jgi:hypothetical protein
MGGMAEDLQESFAELVPSAAAKAQLFLQVVRDRAAQENIGLTFTPRELRKTRQFILEAPVQLGGTFLKGAPMKVIVHADPVGSALQVGWQLTEESLNSVMAMFDSARNAHASQVMRNLKPDNQRRLSALVTAFHRLIFLPVLQLLVEAAEQPSRESRGFLGA